MTNIPIADAHGTAVRVVDAKGMWCPEVRNLYADEDGSGAGYNTNKTVNGGRSRFDFATCIADECMAWRWVPAGALIHPGDEEGSIQASQYEFGYCGKAGGR